MMHGDIDNCSLHHMQQNLISHVKAGVSGFAWNVMKSVLMKLCFYKFSFFFQTTSGISGSTESIDLSCIHVSYVRLYINLVICELEEWLLSTQERAITP